MTVYNNSTSQNETQTTAFIISENQKECFETVFTALNCESLCACLWAIS